MTADRPLTRGAAAWLGGMLAHLVDVGPEGARIRRNVGFLLGDRVVRLAVSLVVNVWLVRYLGVERLGLLSFAQSLVVMFAVFAQLGLDTILVRDLVRRPHDERELLGTAIRLRLSGAVLTLACAVWTALLMRPGDRSTAVLAAIYASMAFSQSLDVLEHWFQSRSRIGPLVVARVSASLVSAVLKIAAILLHARLEIVALVLAAEFALSTLALVIAFQRQPDAPRAWTFRGDAARRLLRDSWPLFLNSVAIVVSVRVDQMILTAIHGPHENGVYAASQRLTEVIYYVPVAVLAAANPALLRAFQDDAAVYARRLQRVFSALALGGLAIAVGVSALAPWIVRLLFGPAFAATAPVLAIQVWTAPMLFLGVAQTNWFIAHDRQRGLLLRSAVAAALSVGLNLALVPVLGARGAAITTLVSQTCGHVLLNACFRETRPLLRMQARAFVPVPPR